MFSKCSVFTLLPYHFITFYYFYYSLSVGQKIEKHTFDFLYVQNFKKLTIKTTLALLFVPEKASVRCRPPFRCKCRRLLLGRLPVAHQPPHLHTHTHTHTR